MKPCTTARELFDERLPTAIRARAADLTKIGGSYAFRVSGSGGGIWTLDLNESPPWLSSSIGPAQALFECSDDDLVEIMRNPASALQLFAQGQLRVSGNVALAVRLNSILQLLE